jgi:hypothetical protein
MEGVEELLDAYYYALIMGLLYAGVIVGGLLFSSAKRKQRPNHLDA